MTPDHVQSGLEEYVYELEDWAAEEEALLLWRRDELSAWYDHQRDFVFRHSADEVEAFLRYLYEEEGFEAVFVSVRLKSHGSLQPADVFICSFHAPFRGAPLSAMIRTDPISIPGFRDEPPL